MTDDDTKQVIRAAAGIIVDAALGLIQADGHQWSDRPCSTCETVSNLLGKPFGCCKYALDKKGARP